MICEILDIESVLKNNSYLSFRVPTQITFVFEEVQI